MYLSLSIGLDLFVDFCCLSLTRLKNCALKTPKKNLLKDHARFNDNSNVSNGAI